MGKIEAIAAFIISAEETIEGIKEFLSVSITDDYYSYLDKLTFLTNETLGLDITGSIIDSTKILGESLCNLTNVIIFCVLLFYAFCSLFQYFLSKKIEVPWKACIRLIIFGVFANCAFFICSTAVFFTESITEYIIDFSGNETSFSIFNSEKYDLDIDNEVEVNDVFIMEDLTKIVAYILIFALSITAGYRFIVIKLIIIFSPVIFILGGSKLTEKVFFKSSILFLKLLVYQIAVVIVLQILKTANFSHDSILQILFVSTAFLCVRFVKKIC